MSKLFNNKLCMKHLDTVTINRINKVYNLNNINDIPNYCLNFTDERHMNKYNDCIDIVTKTGTPLSIDMISELGKTFDDVRYTSNNNVCEYRDTKRCYEKK